MVGETLCGKNAAHTLAYSIIALQEMNLAFNYPIIFWNTACLIVDSGAMNLEEEIFKDNEEDDEEDEEKIKNSSTDYGRIAAAIGKMKSRGISFSLPDINKSNITFTPDIENNLILYGLRGITRIGNQLIKDIINARPYSSIEDFLNKVKVNKTQMVALIKSGSFDNLYNMSREEIMNYYINLISDKKKRITLQNMQMLIAKDLIPRDFEQEVKVFNFNKYLKKFKDDDYYILDNIAMNFFTQNYGSEDLIDVVINNNEEQGKIKQLIWDKIYKKEMDPIRDWMKTNQEEILNRLNNTLVEESRIKYATGNISKWEMDSLSFYYHAHELAGLKTRAYAIEDFNNLIEDEIDTQFYSKDGSAITLFKVHRIAGTVIDKDKNKNLITLLTPSGVVLVKIWKNQFAAWDKQISQRDMDGVKHVIEKSWFTRGTKLIITGIKRDNGFVPKKYKNTPYPLFERIDEIDDNGYITKSATERIEIEE